MAISGIQLHFSVDHKHVIHLNTRLEATNGADLDLKELNDNEMTCFMLINILDDDNQPLSISSSSAKCLKIGDASTKPCLMLLGTKMEILTYVNSSDILNEEEKRSKSSKESTDTLTNKAFVESKTSLLNRDNITQESQSTSRVLIWIASNIPVELSYTLCISSINPRKRLKFFGPMQTYKDKYPTIFEEGLVLNEHHINFLTSQEKYILELVIHEKSESDDSE